MVRRFDAVMFDFDGTLTLPGSLDFALIREEMECPVGTSILAFLENLSDPDERSHAENILLAHELRASGESRPRPSAESVIRILKRMGLKTGIITRNTRASVLRALENCTGFGEGDFELILTREDPFPVKPAPDGVLYAARFFGTEPGRLLVVGDYVYDIEAGNRAGAVTVYLDGSPEAAAKVPDADFLIGDLPELIDIVTS